jgi:hypothetical protein
MAEATGDQLPALETRVDPEPYLQFEWLAFSELSSDRQIGWVVGPIGWTAIDAYAVRHGIEGPDEFERFRFIIRKMDAAFMAWNRKKED